MWQKCLLRHMALRHTGIRGLELPENNLNSKTPPRTGGQALKYDLKEFFSHKEQLVPIGSRRFWKSLKYWKILFIFKSKFSRGGRTEVGYNISFWLRLSSAKRFLTLTLTKREKKAEFCHNKVPCIPCCYLFRLYVTL